MAKESTIVESFTLPSKGLIYDTPIDPNVSLRSMTVMEEMRRLAPSETPYKIMSDIIEDCMQEKPKIHIYDMCLGDYQYLLHKLRIVTYGPEYKMTISCPNCGEIVESTANLDSIEVFEYDDTYSDLAKLTLPVSNKIVEMKYQTPRDLDDIARKKKEMQRKTKLNVEYGLLFTTMSLIKSVDGRVLNPIQLEDFVKKLSMKDVTAIISRAEELNRKVGLDTRVITKCNQCGYEMVSTFRITSEFFGPTNNQ